MVLGVNSGRNSVGATPRSFHGIMIFLAAFLFLGCPHVLTATSTDTAAVAPAADKFDLDADITKISSAENSVELIGNAGITLGETVVTADNIKAFFKKNAEIGLTLKKDAVEKVVAGGNVKIVFGDRVATGNEAVYESAAQSLVLTGEPAALVSGAGTMSSPEINADRIVFHEAEVTAEFIGNIVITRGKTVIEADYVKAFFKKSEDNGLPLNGGSTENIGNSIEKIFARGNVDIVFEDHVATGDEAVFASAGKAFTLTGDPAALVIGADTMTSSEFTADKISLNEAENRAEFIGNVVMRQGETVITARSVKAFLKEGADGALSLKRDSVEKIVASGNSKIVFGDRAAAGDEAAGASAGESFRLNADPAAPVIGADKVTSSEITADTIVFMEAENRAEFIGNVVMTQGETVITARSVKAFFKEGADGALSLKRDSVEKIVASGNAKIVFGDRAAAGDEAANASAGESFRLNEDPAAPVIGADKVTSSEIAADKIIFMEAENRAEFIGNVVMTQGETVITARSVKAFFKEGADGALSLNEGSSENIADSFERVVAGGEVKIVSEDRVATGDEAVYDSSGQSLVLTGNMATLVVGSDTASAPVIEIRGRL